MIKLWNILEGIGTGFVCFLISWGYILAIFGFPQFQESDTSIYIVIVLFVLIITLYILAGALIGMGWLYTANLIHIGICGKPLSIWEDNENGKESTSEAKSIVINLDDRSICEYCGRRAETDEQTKCSECGAPYE